MSCRSLEQVALTEFSPAVRAWFSSSFPEPTPAQSLGWRPDLAGRAHPDPRPHGFGEDARRVPLGDRPAGRADPCPTGDAVPGALHLAAARARIRRREESAGTAGGHQAGGRAPRRAVYRTVVGMRTGDTSSRDRSALIRHPPDMLITTPESLYLMLTSSARDTLRSVDTRHRRRDPRARRHEARRASRAFARAARGDHRQAVPADRSVGDAASPRRDRPVPRRQRRRAGPTGDDRRRGDSQAARRRGRRSRRGHGRARRGDRGTDERPRRRGSRSDAASGPRCIRACSS